MDITHSIVPAPAQSPGHVTVDGKPTVQGNLFRVDFIKPSFDRRKSITAGVPPPQSLDLGDPPITFAFGVLNDWIERYKYLARSSNVRPVRIGETLWKLEYLTDDEKLLPQDPDLLRLRTSWRHVGRFDLIDKTIWDRVQAIPIDYKPEAWEVLLLDAAALLPEIGPSVVLAYAALEAFIDWCLDKLAPLANIPPLLWEWINTRDNSFWLTPRTAEQFDVILKSLTGKSLKTEAKLWETFKNLQGARHSFVHTGHATIGNEDVTLELANELVGGASQIVAWAEALLPKDLRRPELEAKHTITAMTVFPIATIATAGPKADVGPEKPEA